MVTASKAVFWARSPKGAMSLAMSGFLSTYMSGFIVNQQQSGLWESRNPAQFAGFPSAVGKSGL